MSDYNTACNLAKELMANPPKVTSKVGALDGLDRLALNPNGWFPARILEALTKARMAILVDRWHDAMVTLEGAFSSLEAFIAVLDERAEKAQSSESAQAVTQAKNELEQCSLVQAYVVARSVESA